MALEINALEAVDACHSWGKHSRSEFMSGVATSACIELRTRPCRVVVSRVSASHLSILETTRLLRAQDSSTGKQILEKRAGEPQNQADDSSMCAYTRHFPRPSLEKACQAFTSAYLFDRFEEAGHARLIARMASRLSHPDAQARAAWVTLGFRL